MNYTCILFDLDNTLLKKTPTVPEKAYEILKKHNVNIEPETLQMIYAHSEYWIGEQILRENETGVIMDDNEFIGNILSFYSRHFNVEDQLKEELTEIITGNYESSVCLADNAEHILRLLSNAGIRLGIVSNNRAKIRTTLDTLGITEYFDSIVISDEVGLSKPNPEIMNLAISQIGSDKLSVLYVGDHPFDILCAHNAGIHVAWCPPNRFYTLNDSIDSPEYKIQSLDELLQLIFKD